MCILKKAQAIIVGGVQNTVYRHRNHYGITVLLHEWSLLLAQAVAVATDPSSIRNWRPVFGDLEEGYNLRRFWSHVDPYP
jgi:hypothetical protein